MENEYKIVKKYQIAMRRLYNSNTPCKGFVKVLGINRNGFIQHIDKQLICGMEYHNFGSTWSLDHIVPMHLFDLSDSESLALCYNYKNIMPTFNYDNKVKGGSVHFSLMKLKTLPRDSIVDRLIKLCEDEIEKTYNKYL